jgi:hypothetical protein
MHRRGDVGEIASATGEALRCVWSGLRAKGTPLVERPTIAPWRPVAPSLPPSSAVHRPAVYPARQVCLQIDEHVQQRKNRVRSLCQQKQLGSLLVDDDAEHHRAQRWFWHSLRKLHQGKGVMRLQRGFALLDQFAGARCSNRH